MQIFLNGGNLHEMTNPVFWEKRRNKFINLSSAELAQRLVKFKQHVSCKRPAQFHMSAAKTELHIHAD